MAVDKAWFEMADVRRKRMSNSVWIPLRQAETSVVEGAEGKSGNREEVACAGTIAFLPVNRELGERLGWSDLGVSNRPVPYAFEDGRYKPADVYQYRDGEDAGVHLVVGEGNWHVNQDLVLALELVREGDNWIRPSEGFVEVIRERKDASGKVNSIEIKAEFLRDYLAARGLALRIATFRDRTAICPDVSMLPAWKDNPVLEQGKHERFEIRSYEVDENGRLPGSMAVTRVWRTDVDANDDVPVMGPETNENTDYTHAIFEGLPPVFTKVRSSLWRKEWFEPGTYSERVRGDESADQISYAVEADGGRLPGSALQDEDIGRWLWFRPSVIPELIGRRGGQLSWYTAQTGGVQCSPGWSTQFGVNKIGLINVYAYDIAKLPMWQQRIWSGHNVAPDGPVSGELLASHVRAMPADTTPPEVGFSRLRHKLNKLSTVWCAGELFKSHASEAEILRSIHRFRSLDKAGLLSLAKDLARLTADSIDTTVLARVTRPEKDQKKWGSLRHLENALATISAPEVAREAVGRLVGIYDLRLGDAHLPSSQIKDAFSLAGVDPEALQLDQGVQLIEAAVTSLSMIVKVIQNHLQCVASE